MASNAEFLISTNDVASLISMFNTANGYLGEANLHFNKDGFGMRFDTPDGFGMVDFESHESKLLTYSYQRKEDIYYLGVELKECYRLLKTIPIRTVGQIYKVEGDDDLYINPLGSDTVDGAAKITTKILPVNEIEPPHLDNENYIKMSTCDFHDMCVTLNGASCKIIRFTIKNKTLLIKGFDDKDSVKYARYFKSGLSNYEDEEEDITEEESPVKTKKGKFNLIINKKTPEDQVTVDTTIDKLKPLAKINSLCKNGIVYVHVFKNEKSGKIIALRTNTGQSGVFTVYLLDKSSVIDIFNRDPRNYGYYN